jgi:hypothetical protein
MDYYGRRNDILFAWCHTPLSRLGPHLLGTTFNGLRSAWRSRRFRHHLRGLVSGWTTIFGEQSPRKPVSTRVYHLFRKLKKRGPLRLTDIESSLPNIPEIVSIRAESPKVYSTT